MHIYPHIKKTAAESHRILVEVYGEHALAERMCQKWFARFRSGDFGLEDEECLGSQKSLNPANQPNQRQSRISMARR